MREGKLAVPHCDDTAPLMRLKSYVADLERRIQDLESQFHFPEPSLSFQSAESQSGVGLAIDASPHGQSHSSYTKNSPSQYVGDSSEIEYVPNTFGTTERVRRESQPVTALFS